jgi:predicted GH43/DUF377 family glycosyl hydrolase
MNKYLILCISLILGACATPVVEIAPTVEIKVLPAVPSPIPITPESRSFFTAFGEDPIVPKGITGTWDDRFTDPGAVIYYGGMFHMFRNGFRGFPAPSQVGYVTSPDGYTWTKQGDQPVFETKDVPYAKIAMYASSALVEADGTWVIYFYTWDSRSFPSSSVIGRASASAPTGPWVPDVDPVLLPGTSGDWDDQQVLAPHVIQTEDGYIMYYSGTNKAGRQEIGMATSSDGIKWVKNNDPSTTKEPYVESDPILQPGEPGSWDMNWVHQPRVLVTDQGWVMFYRGTKDSSENSMALGLAASEDGIHWEKYSNNPIFVPTEISKSHQFWFHNALLVDDTFFLFVEGDINQTTQIYLATHEGKALK